MLVTVWLAVALVLGSDGEVSAESGVFETKEQCARVQEQVAVLPRVIAVSPCIEVKMQPRKSDS